MTSYGTTKLYPINVAQSWPTEQFWTGKMSRYYPGRETDLHSFGCYRVPHPNSMKEKVVEVRAQMSLKVVLLNKQLLSPWHFYHCVALVFLLLLFLSFFFKPSMCALNKLEYAWARKKEKKKKGHRTIFKCQHNIITQNQV